MRSDPNSAPDFPAPYWRSTRRLTGWLIAAWFALTFGALFFARELANFTLFGWSFPFYMAAQGLPLAYLLIIVFYARRMRYLDRNPAHVTDAAQQ